jgi:hypothetical protein
MMRVAAAIAGGISMLYACTTSASCDCPGMPGHVVISGTVRRSDQAPASEVMVTIREYLGLTCGPAGDVPEAATSVLGLAETDAEGRFVAEVFSSFGNGERCLRVTAVAEDDSARVWLPAPFRNEDETPDTTEVMLTLGEN